jgi:small subunit ribosomal protein S16
MRGGDVRLRLARWGRAHRPFYRIVAARRGAPRDGKFLERLGTYNPIPDREGNKHVTLNVDRINRWLADGATPTETVGWLLSRAEVIPPWPRRGINGPGGPAELLPDEPSVDELAADAEALSIADAAVAEVLAAEEEAAGEADAAEPGAQAEPGGAAVPEEAR